jgi:methylisocitrate lyase
VFAQGKCISVPGAYTGLVGRIVADKGFKAAYISGAAVTASAGVPDIGILTLDHFSRVIDEVSTASGLPLICDADTGFGEAEMVKRLVRDYEKAGAAALHIEDQVFPKRCGHLDGKELVSSTAFCDKVERARQVADSLNSGFIVCARTDARSVHGFDAAVKRATEYVHAGAEMIFPESLATKEEFKIMAEEMKKLPGPAPGGGPYMLANMTEFGKTDYISTPEFNELGYHCVIFPVTTLRCAMKPVQEVLDLMAAEGSAEKYVPKMFTRQELYKTIRYKPGEEWTYPSASS